MEEEICNKCVLLRNSKNFTKDFEWVSFERVCTIADSQFNMFASKIRQRNILNETEIRLCILVLLNMGRAEISQTLPYSINSVGKLKDQTAKLLGTTGKNLHDFLMKIAIEG